jgi:protein gp37
VSVEPMLGPVDLASASGVTFWDDPSAGLHWVIAGPETGPGARICDHFAFQDLEAQCAAAGVAFFDKRKGGIRREWPG